MLMQLQRGRARAGAECKLIEEIPRAPRTKLREIFHPYGKTLILIRSGNPEATSGKRQKTYYRTQSATTSP